MLDRTIKIMVCGLVLCAVAMAPDVAFAISGKTEEVQNCSSSCNGDGTIMNITSYTNVVVQVCCTFTGTVTFKDSIDGVNFDAVECVSTANWNTRASSTTSRGQWRCNVNSMNKFKAEISGYSSGTMLVTVGASSAGVN